MQTEFELSVEDSDEDYTLTTEDLAAELRLKPQTLRKRLCLTGSYFGEVPRKGRNGRWWWSRRAPVRLRTKGPTDAAMHVTEA